jgi:SAM-dependent methyltransferase
MKFVCPYCHQDLEQNESAFLCDDCSLEFLNSNGVYWFYNPERADWQLAVETAQRHLVSHSEVEPLPCNPGWPYSLMPFGDEDIDAKVRVAIFNIAKEILWAFLDGREDAIGLDIGGFTGWTSYLLAEFLPVVSVDIYEPALALVDTSVGHGIVPVVADGIWLPLPDECLDLVFMFATYHHMTDRLAGLNEWWRVLKPGGKLMVLADSHLPASYIKENKQYAYDMGEFCYTEEEMEKEFDASRFWDISYLGVEYCDEMEYKNPDAIVKQSRVDNGLILASKW